MLNDNNHRDHALYFACAAVGRRDPGCRRRIWNGAATASTRGIIWLSGLLGLPMFAFAVSMIASERYATYRTILAMTGVLLCFLVASVSALTARWSTNARRMLAAVVFVARVFHRAASCVRIDRRAPGQ